MKKVKYNGDYTVIMPTLGIEVNPGDTVDVEDDFNNDHFAQAEEETKTVKKKGDNE